MLTVLNKKLFMPTKIFKSYKGFTMVNLAKAIVLYGSYINKIFILLIQNTPEFRQLK